MSEIFTQPISAQLLRVLAQAAEGYPNQGDMYFVALYEPKPNGSYEVSPWFSQEDAAGVVDVLNAVAPNAFGVFGPFDTTLPYPSNPEQETVASWQVTTTTPAGGTGTPFTMGGETMYDALFCSPAAVIKFAVPYYTRVYSPEFAATMLQAFLQAPLALMTHLPWSEYGEIEPDGALNLSEAPPSPAEPSPTGLAAWLPVLFERDEQGGFREKRIYPPTPPRLDSGLPLP